MRLGARNLAPIRSNGLIVFYYHPSLACLDHFRNSRRRKNDDFSARKRNAGRSALSRPNCRTSHFLSSGAERSPLLLSLTPEGPRTLASLRRVSGFGEFLRS